MSETVITMIYPANIPPLWHQVEPLLVPAINIMGTHNPEDIYKAIMAGKAQLWVQWSGKVEAAAVTEFAEYPRELNLRIWLTGAAKGAKILWDEFWKTFNEFACKSGCTEIEDLGRGGWDKYAEKYAPTARRIAILRRVQVKPVNKEVVASRIASGG